jgi:putative hydrolase of the HAD superfamily
MVLSGEPDAETHAKMVRIAGLPVERFEVLYWADRLEYDRGALTGVTFWQKFVRDAGIALEPAAVGELQRLDAILWTTQNPAMLAWQMKLKEHGLITGILSNMGEDVLINIKKEFDWLPRFDVLVWSYELKMVKPEPAIYKHLLKELRTRPEETLFLDDKLVNVRAARALGIKALEFTTVTQLRRDLIAAGLDEQLPLP